MTRKEEQTIELNFAIHKILMDQGYNSSDAYNVVTRMSKREKNKMVKKTGLAVWQVLETLKSGEKIQLNG